MVCYWLNRIYGRDSHSTQVINFLLSTLWAVGLALHLLCIVQLDIPSYIDSRAPQFLGFSVASALFSLLGMMTTRKAHQVIKFFGISLGAVLQGILANGYVSAYPPLETMLVINLAVLFWFLGALLYISRCEGFDGRYSGRH